MAIEQPPVGSKPRGSPLGRPGHLPRARRRRRHPRDGRPGSGLVRTAQILLLRRRRDAEHPERLVSAGTPLEGVEVRVVDPATLRDVETGESGELWFRTEQATPGYLGNPDATVELLTDDGWLRSGVIGRVGDGGFMFVEVRVKDMIISGGENVYSPEIERVLAKHPAILELAVIGVPDDTWENQSRPSSPSSRARRPLRENSSPSPAKSSRSTHVRRRSTSWKHCRATPPARSPIAICASPIGPIGSGRSEALAKETTWCPRCGPQVDLRPNRVA